MFKTHINLSIKFNQLEDKHPIIQSHNMIRSFDDMDSQSHRQSFLGRKECWSWCQGFGRNPHRKFFIKWFHHVRSLNGKIQIPTQKTEEKTNLMDWISRWCWNTSIRKWPVWSNLIIKVSNLIKYRASTNWTEVPRILQIIQCYETYIKLREFNAKRLDKNMNPL